MKYLSIGANIKKYRELNGYTQKQLAQELGISGARLSNWELGVNRPDVEMLGNICSILNVSANTILELDEQAGQLSDEALRIARAYDAALPEIREAISSLLSLSDKMNKN